MLVDAGCGQTAPDAGKHLRGVEALGIAPGDVDAVLMTHLHRDHTAGLVDPNGRAVLPRAELVVHEDDLAFWRDEGNITRLRPSQRWDFSIATTVLAAYADRVRPILACEVTPGVSAILTPGHTAWLIGSQGEHLLIWGDVVHLPAIQFSNPEASVVYDLDSEAAAATRWRLLDMVAADRLPVAGVHLDLGLSRFGGHPEAFAQGVPSWPRRIPLHAGVPPADSRAGPCRACSGRPCP